MSAPTTVTLTIPDFAEDADTLTVALQLAAAGIYVLPCVHGTKDPGSILGRNWQSKSSRDPEQIIAWFAGTNLELMIHCGRSGLVVIDIDTPDQLPDLIGKHLPSAPFQSTRVDVLERGHAIFAMPPGRIIRQQPRAAPQGVGRNSWSERRDQSVPVLARHRRRPVPVGAHRPGPGSYPTR